MKIALDIRKSLEKNAEKYFEKAKKARKKQAGAKKALEKTKAKLEKAKLVPVQEQAPIESRMRKKRDWYEKFRWFYSSDGFLVIGGRDATTNEMVIKKYTDPKDKVFHTDMAGSPFVVVKAEDKEIPETTINEAATFTISCSRAWKAGLGTAAVFCVNPDQVSKQAKAGEFLPKGAFMIYGETNYIDVNMNYAVGIYEDKVMGGPVSAVEANCEKHIVINQGDKKPSEVAKLIRSKLGGDLDDIIRVMPPGGVEA